MLCRIYVKIVYLGHTFKTLRVREGKILKRLLCSLATFIVLSTTMTGIAAAEAPIPLPSKTNLLMEFTSCDENNVEWSGTCSNAFVGTSVAPTTAGWQYNCQPQCAQLVVTATGVKLFFSPDVTFLSAVVYYSYTPPVDPQQYGIQEVKPWQTFEPIDGTMPFTRTVLKNGHENVVYLYDVIASYYWKGHPVSTCSQAKPCKPTSMSM